MKTLWFRYTYIALLLSSKFRPRVIPMLYSFYLIVYLICISYFIYSYYIYLYLILLFLFFICCFFVCRLYIGFSFIIDIMGICVYLFYVCCLVIRIGIILSLTSLSLGFCVCLFFGFYDNIWDSFHILFLWWFLFIIDYVIMNILDLW